VRRGVRARVRRKNPRLSTKAASRAPSAQASHLADLGARAVPAHNHLLGCGCEEGAGCASARAAGATATERGAHRKRRRRRRARTVDAAAHVIHLLVVAVVQKPDGGVAVVLLERHCAGRRGARETRHARRDPKKRFLGVKAPGRCRHRARACVAVGHVQAAFVRLAQQDAHHALARVLAHVSCAARRQHRACVPLRARAPRRAAPWPRGCSGQPRRAAPAGARPRCLATPWRRRAARARARTGPRG
jgi:hypothetical protein